MTFTLFDAPRSMPRTIPLQEPHSVLWWGQVPKGENPIEEMRPWLAADILARALRLHGPLEFRAICHGSDSGPPPATTEAFSAFGISGFQWVSSAEAEALHTSGACTLRGIATPAETVSKLAQHSHQDALTVAPFALSPSAEPGPPEASALVRALSQYEGLTLRYALLRRAHYRSAFVFREGELESASARVGSLRPRLA